MLLLSKNRYKTLNSQIPYKLHMKTKLLNENPNHKCGQTNDHLFIERKSVSTSKSFNYCFAAISSHETVSVHGCPRAFSRQCAKTNALEQEQFCTHQQFCCSLKQQLCIFSAAGQTAAAWPSAAQPFLRSASLQHHPLLSRHFQRGSPCSGQWWSFHTRQRLAVVLGTTNVSQSNIENIFTD